jgi:hypothetical protein
VELSSIELSDNAGGFVINGVSAGDVSGFSVSSAGDVNGDGLADLIVGAKYDDPKRSGNGANNSESGASFVVFGKTDGTAVELSAIELSDNTGGFVINGISSSDRSGNSVSSAGDVNDDGLADLIVGAVGDHPNGSVYAFSSGASTVVFGKTDGTAVELLSIEIESESGASGFVINGVSGFDYSGVSVSSAGDVNGDGLADLIVGANGDDPNGNSNSGASFVVFGKTDGTTVELSTIESGAGGFVINGVSAGDNSGFSVSSAGDVNGDGLADLIVGAFHDDPNGNGNTGFSSGASFVVFGKTDGTAVELSSIESGAGGFVINGVSADDRSGVSVSSAGDVNGDGFADLIVGAFRDDPNGNGNTGFSSGASFVVFGGQGSNATIGTTGVDTLTGDGTANQLVAGQGDDTLIGNGGADVLRGGAGDDVLAISDTAFASLDGGLGTDTLRLDAAITLNLAAIPNSRLSSLEVIDLNNTGSTVILNNDDILSIVGDEAANDLRINGATGDTLNLNSNGFGATGGTEVINAVTYDIYSNAALDTSVRLLVQQSIGVTDVDTSVVVFDLVNGVSSDHSSRTFNVNESYTIYVVVDATSSALNTTPTTANATWGSWSGGANLSGDDTVVLVSGDGAVVLGIVNGIVNGENESVNRWEAAGGSAALLDGNGDFHRYHNLLSVTNNVIGNSVSAGVLIDYGPAIPAGVLTSQGLV